ncbi:MAG: Rid family detoxifying hydrolase [Candidatus Nanoarchaeia archaeon]
METVSTKNAPQPVGAYSQAVIAGDFMFVSGQIPLTPNGGLIEGDIKEQTKRTLENVKEILSEKNLGFSNVVRFEIYLDDINNFKEVDEVYAQIIGKNKPARQAMEAANLPKGAKIEVSCIAWINKG